MPEDPESVKRVASQVSIALESSDLTAFSDLLDPDVRWGPPGDPSPPCQNREQVLAWYQRGRNSGARAQVTEVTVLGDRVLVGLVVSVTPSAQVRSGQALRWQVLTVRQGRVVDIVGFDQRSQAIEAAEVAAGDGTRE
jgi:ketosteroid isomerase-like protein